MFLWNYLVTKLTGSVVWRDVHLLGNNIFLSIAMWVSMIWSIDTVKNYWKTDRKKSILFNFAYHNNRFSFIFYRSLYLWICYVFGILFLILKQKTSKYFVYYFVYWSFLFGTLSSTRVCNFVHEYTMGNDFGLAFDAFIQLTKREVQFEIFILYILPSSFMGFVFSFRILQIKKILKIFFKIFYFFSSANVILFQSGSSIVAQNTNQ